ncbi:hypothetical protein MG293_003237 [Ovis ammon polii]|uniref:Uncharacterized protein n=1 Tax=Ovis ammon polii TaxID=230172 RepID=A0AAD4UL80_OVIAM|nr:hypothetical protein MG293_003237 [Ovis ammon polii]
MSSLGDEWEVIQKKRQKNCITLDINITVLQYTAQMLQLVLKQTDQERKPPPSTTTDWISSRMNIKNWAVAQGIIFILTLNVGSSFCSEVRITDWRGTLKSLAGSLDSSQRVFGEYKKGTEGSFKAKEKKQQ